MGHSSGIRRLIRLGSVGPAIINPDILACRDPDYRVPAIHNQMLYGSGPVLHCGSTDVMFKLRTDKPGDISQRTSAYITASTDKNPF